MKIDDYEISYGPKGRGPFRHVCPVCGKLCGMRGGMTQHMRSHVKKGDVALVEIPREAFDYYVDLPDGRRFRA